MVLKKDAEGLFCVDYCDSHPIISSYMIDTHWLSFALFYNAITKVSIRVRKKRFKGLINSCKVLKAN